MKALRLGLAALAVGVAVNSPLAGAPAQRTVNPTVEELLKAGGRYIAEYESKFSAIVSQERYEQSNSPLGMRISQRRTLLSDLILINGGAAGWFALRDVFQVDGMPVRDHTDRLMKLMLDPAPDAFAQASRLAQESARFNLGNMNRTINLPTMTLLFLRAEFQGRSKFSFEGMKTVDRIRVAQLDFKETAMPRVIRSLDNAAAEGKFWLEPVTGRVVQTEFSLKSAGNSTKITVRYASQPAISVWVPVKMDETMFSSTGSVSGHADYSNFRSFAVDVATKIK